MLALTPVHHSGGRDAGPSSKPKELVPVVMDRMNDRWDRRHEER
jgi:hypothetical protein